MIWMGESILMSFVKCGKSGLVINRYTEHSPAKLKIFSFNPF